MYVGVVMSQRIENFIKNNLPANSLANILNIGAGNNTEFENEFQRSDLNFICDRIDIDMVSVSHPSIRNQWKTSVEFMPMVHSGLYDVAFTNFVLEHVIDIPSSAKEIYRVMKKGGRFFATVPNPSALEFLIARVTPLWFHKLIRQEESWPTFYNYKNIKRLISLFESAGFTLIDSLYQPCYYLYFRNYPLISHLARTMDNLLISLNNKKLLGHVFLEFEK